MNYEEKLATVVLELGKKGYCVKRQNIFKNGELRDALLVEATDTAYAVFFIDRIIGGTPDEIAAYIEHAMLNNDAPDIRLDDPEYVLKHIYIGLQRASDEPVTKRPSPFEDIDEYLCIRQVEQNGVLCAKLPAGSLWADLTEEELWSKAYENVCNDTIIRTIEDVIFGIAEKNGVQIAPETSISPIPIYIVTGNNTNKGAAAILNRQAIKDFAEKHEADKIIMLPLSVHEVLILPYNSESMDELSGMVKDINLSTVALEDQLGNKAYLIDVKDYVNNATI
jgi:hypothetical protein